MHETEVIGSLHLSLTACEHSRTVRAEQFAECLERHGCALLADEEISREVIGHVFGGSCGWASQGRLPTSDIDHDGSAPALTAAVDDDLTGPESTARSTRSAGGVAAVVSGVIDEGGTTFRDDLNLRLFLEIHAISARVLKSLAEFLWLDADWFSGPTADCAGLVTTSDPRDLGGHTRQFRRWAGLDVLSLLIFSEKVELEVQHRWHPEDVKSITIMPGQVLVLSGWMLQRLTNDILQPSLFRMAAAGGEANSLTCLRFSVPFRGDYQIETIAECIDVETYPNHYPEVTCVRSLAGIRA